MATDTPGTHVMRWIVGVIAALAIVALLAYARREPGFDDRVPDPDDAAALILQPASAGAA